MFLRKTKYSLVWGVVLVTIVLALLARLNTAPYRAALADLYTPERVGQLQDQERRLGVEMKRYHACGELLQQDAPVGADFRNCLLAALPTVKTDKGDVLFADGVQLWLDTHPDDEALRAGWDNFRAMKHAYYDPMERLAELYDQLLILRLKDGRQAPARLGDHWQRELEEAEYALRLPAVARQQAERRWAIGRGQF